MCRPLSSSAPWLRQGLPTDLMGVPTILLARTDACTANLITSDVDGRDRKFLADERTQEGFFVIDGGSKWQSREGWLTPPTPT